MSNQLVIFEQGSVVSGDSGERGNSTAAGGGVDSVKPTDNGERCLAEVYNRPTENIRQRTERLRDATEQLLYRIDNDVWFFSAGNASGVGTAQNIPTISTWDTSGGPDDGTFIITQPMVVNGYATPDVDKQETVVYDFPVGAPTADLTISLLSTKRAYNLANNIRLKWESATAAELAGALVPNRCDAVVSGDPERILTITVESTGLTQIAHVDTALLAITADLTTMGISFVTSGVNTTPVTIADITAPNPDTDYRMTKTYERNLYYIPVASFSDYFFNNPGLQDGDTLAIYFADFDTKRQTTVSNSNTTITDSMLFNTRTYPERIPNCIPLCKRIGDNLFWRDGTYVQPNQGTELVFGEHGRTVERILSVATTIDLSAYSTGSPLTVDPFSLTADPIQTNLESLTDFLNKKPSLDANEVVSGDWEFTGQFFANRPGGPSISALTEHQFLNNSYSVDNSDKRFLEASIGVNSVGSVTHGVTSFHAYAGMVSAVGMNRLRGILSTVYVDQGTFNDRIEGLYVDVDVVSSAATNRTTGLRIDTSVETTSTEIQGLVAYTHALATTVATSMIGIDVETRAYGTLPYYTGTSTLSFLANTSNVSTRFTGALHQVDVQFDAGAHTLSDGFYCELLRVDVAKELTLASDPFYGKLAEYTILADIGNSAYLDSITYTHASNTLSGNLYGRHAALDISDTTLTAVYGLRTTIESTFTTACQVYAGIYMDIETYGANDVFGYFCDVTLKGNTLGYRTIRSATNINASADVTGDSYGIFNGITYFSGCTSPDVAVYGIYSYIIAACTDSSHSDSEAVVGLRTEVIGDAAGDYNDGHFIGALSRVSSSGTMGSLIGNQTELYATTGHTISNTPGIIGHLTKIDNDTSINETYSILCQSSSNENYIVFENYHSNGNGNYLELKTSASNTLGTPLETVNNDNLGHIRFYGCNTSDAFTEAAQLKVSQIGAATSDVDAALRLEANGADPAHIELHGDDSSIHFNGSINLNTGSSSSATPDSNAGPIIDCSNATITSILNPSVGKVVILINTTGGAISYTDTGNIDAAGTIASGECTLFVALGSGQWHPCS